MTRTKPAEQRRADLLAASEELFLAKGVAATSLDDITSRAGVSKGLFYLYFRSKDDLLVAMQNEFSVRLADRMRAATDLAEDWPARLDTCVQAIFDSYQESHDLHEVLFHHGGHVSADHRPAHALMLQALSDLLADGKAAGAFDVEDPEATAVLCWASTHGFDPGFQSEPAPADARLVRAAQQLFRRAAGVTAGPRELSPAQALKARRLPPGRRAGSRDGAGTVGRRVSAAGAESYPERSGPPPLGIIVLLLSAEQVLEKLPCAALLVGGCRFRGSGGLPADSPVEDGGARKVWRNSPHSGGLMEQFPQNASARYRIGCR
jgi:TetR/AcrR family transcriptional regulator, transcriptional repressor for nem operon